MTDEAATDRRPIAARRSGWAARASRALARVGFTPNQVSVASVLFALAAGLLLAGSAEVGGVARAIFLALAAIAIQLRLLCNLLDGMMAVEEGRRTPVGVLFNELPDRLADALVLLGAGCASRHLALAAPLAWLATGLAVTTAYVRMLGAANGLPQDFRGPMAKQHRMAAMTVACVASTIDPLWRGEGEVLRAALAVVAVGCAVTIVRRVRRAARELERREAPLA